MTSWLVDTFQMEPGWARGIGFFLAVAIVLALISVFVWVLRRIAGSRSLGSRSRQPRIAVMDAASLDARRRLVLIRRDNVEHLLLVGGPSDVVVEQNIVRGVPISQAYPRQPAMGAEVPAPYVPAEIEPQPAAPAPQPAATFAPAMPAQTSTPQASMPQTSMPQAAAAPQPAPRRPLPPAAPAPRRPAEGGDASPLKRAGASVAAAGAAVAGLARSAT
ncbi:flagellar biosynthetic protein FliO, partial [Stappia sp. P2PMeth1]|uniref:flagellar biosynthetic protein FliO n=1 Tax=Stappia sp. P2PMeth1 TaxID=2003586 RepID=UPI001FCA8242